MDLRKPVALTLWLALPASTTLAAQNTIIVTGGGRALIVTGAVMEVTKWLNLRITSALLNA